MFFRTILLCICLPFGSTLMPKKLPNGRPRTFMPNLENPREDLQVISAGTASLITKNWLQNILIDVMCHRRSKQLNTLGEFLYDDLHIVSCIQELQTDIEQSQKKLSNSWGDIVNTDEEKSQINHTESSPRLLYFAWKPKSVQGFNEVLFLVIASVVRDKNIDEHYFLDIKNIIQSPFWDDEQIQSIYLKQAIIDQNRYTNRTELRFDSLYKNNMRYKLAWETWYKEDAQKKP